MRNSFFTVLAAVALALGMTVGVADAAHGPHGGPHGGNGGISGTQPTGDSSARSGRQVTCTDSGVVVLGTSTCQTSFDNGHSLTCTITAGDTCTDTLQGLGGVGRNGGGLGGLGGAFGGGLDRRGPGGRWPYPGLPGGFPEALNGNLLSLSALYPGLNANVNICLYPSFQQFDAFAGPHYGGGWTIARNQWFHPEQATAEWLALQQAAGCGSGVVLPQGLAGFNGMINGSFLNLSQYGINGYSQLNNLCTYGNWDGFAGALRSHLRGNGWNGLQTKFGRDRGMWTNNFNQLQMQMGCSSGGVVVAPISQPVYPAPVDPAPVVTPAPVAAPPTVDVTPPAADDVTPPAPVAPAPPSGSTIVEVPSGAPNGGDSGLAPDAVWVR